MRLPQLVGQALDLLLGGAALHAPPSGAPGRRAAPARRRRGRRPRSAAPSPRASRRHRQVLVGRAARSRVGGGRAGPMKTPHCGVNCRARSAGRRARSGRGLRSSGSSTSLRRCSTSALASGLVKGRCGSVKSIGVAAALLPGLVLGDQRHLTRRRPRDASERSTGDLGLGRRLVASGRASAMLRRRHQRAARQAVGLLDQALGGGDAVIVLALVGQGEGAARVRPPAGPRRRSPAAGREWPRRSSRPRSRARCVTAELGVAGRA